MPLGTFDESVKKDLALCGRLDRQPFVTLARSALTFLQHGASSKLVAAVAEKIGAPVPEVASAVSGLCKLILEGGKLKLSPEKFASFLADFELPEDLEEALVEIYNESYDDIAEAVKELAERDGLPSFSNLEWRLDMEVGSRFVGVDPKPSFLLRLETSGGGAGGGGGGGEGGSSSGKAKSTCLLESDYANLRRLDEELDAALRHADSTHCKRIERYLK